MVWTLGSDPDDNRNLCVVSGAATPQCEAGASQNDVRKKKNSVRTTLFPSFGQQPLVLYSNNTANPTYGYAGGKILACKHSGLTYNVV